LLFIAISKDVGREPLSGVGFVVVNALPRDVALLCARECGPPRRTERTSERGPPPAISVLPLPKALAGLNISTKRRVGQGVKCAKWQRSNCPLPPGLQTRSGLDHRWVKLLGALALQNYNQRPP